jgi:hypothetical protein
MHSVVGGPMATGQGPNAENSTSRNLKARFQGGRKWAAGIIIAALTAVLTQAFTGAFSSVGSGLWAAIRGRDPVEIAVSSDFVTFQKQHLGLPEYVIPRPLDQIAAPPGQDQEIEKREQWAANLGGVQANHMDVQVTILGRSAEPVILTNLRVRIVSRRFPLRGTHITYGPIGEGVFERYLSVNLDSSPPKITDSVDQRFLVEGDPKDEKPVRFPYKVSQTDPEVFYIAVNTKKCDCTWIAELFWTTRGKNGSTIIDDNGRPFRVTSSGNSASYYSNDGQTFVRTQA